MNAPEILWTFIIPSGLVVSLLFIWHFYLSLRNLGHAPRPLSKGSKQRLIVFLAEHRSELREGHPQITLVPLHDPDFCEKIEDVFLGVGWDVRDNQWSDFKQYEKGIRVFGSNKFYKNVIVEAFAAIGLKADLDESDPAWSAPALVTFGK